MIRKLMKLCKLTEMINHLSEKSLYVQSNACLAPIELGDPAKDETSLTPTPCRDSL